jgi:hypothetical protein
LFSWHLPQFEPNDCHCSGGAHFAAEYVFFFGSGLLLLVNIISDYDHFPKDTETLEKTYFTALKTSISLFLIQAVWPVGCDALFLERPELMRIDSHNPLQPFCGSILLVFCWSGCVLTRADLLAHLNNLDGVFFFYCIRRQ